MKLSERLAQLAKETEEAKRTEPATGRERRQREERRKEQVPVPRDRRSEDDRRAAAEEAAAEAADPDALKLRSTVKPTPAETPDYSQSQKKEGLEVLKSTVRAAVVKEMGPKLVSGIVDERELRNLLERHLGQALASSSVTVSPSDRGRFFEEMIADMVGWGPLEALTDDPTVTEIMCNGHDEVWIERSGVVEKTDISFPSVGSYRQVVDRMLAVAGRRVDESSPMADGRLRDGSRVNAIIPPLVVGEPVLTIRRFPERMHTMADLVEMESLSPGAGEFLEACIAGKLNVLISGGTGTGKTTLLNVLSNFIPDHERVITIEDAAELRLDQPHIVRLESRPANIEGAGEISIRDLVRNSLRMRPDRIVVGEVRGAEALDMLQAMNTGHEGSLTTVHANTPRDALARIETMVLFSGLDLPLRAVREQVAAALDVIIQLERRNDGKRVISLIAEIQGREGETITMQDIYKRTAQGPLVATGLRPIVAEKLKDRGVEIPPKLFRAPEGAAPKPASRSRRAKS